MSARTLNISNVTEMPPILVDYVCAALGRQPVDAVVAVHLTEDHTLSAVAHYPRATALGEPALPEGHPRVVLIEFTDPDQMRDARAAAHGFTAQHMAAKYNAAGVTVLDVIVFNGVNRWHSLNTGERGRHTVGTSPAGAHLSMRQSNPEPALPTPSGSADLAQRVVSLSHYAECHPDPVEAFVHLLPYSRWLSFLGDTMSEDDHAALLALMERPMAVRLFLRMMTTSDLPEDDGAEPLAGHFPDGVEWAMVDTCLEQLMALANAAPASHAHGPVLLMGWLEWYKGRGSRADRLLAALDPAHTPNLPIPPVGTVAPIALDPAHAYRPTC